MSSKIVLQVEPMVKLEELLLRNYPKIQAKLPKGKELPKPETMDLFGQDSDRYSFVIGFGSAGQLHMFHYKQRSWIDAGFLEITNVNCLYDKSNNPLGGIKVFRLDVGQNIVTVTKDYEAVLPFLVIPIFFKDLRYSILSYSAPPSPQCQTNWANEVTSQVLGFLRDATNRIFYSLNDDKVNASKKVDNDFMDKVTSTVPTLHFNVIYTN